MKVKSNTSLLSKTTFVWFISAFLIIISCNKSIEPSIEYAKDFSTQTVLTKANNHSFQVSFSEVEWLIKNLYPDEGLFDIEAYPNDEDPLMYVVNFDKGWKIVAGDKRIDPILAYNDEGKMKVTNSSNPGLKIWLEEITNIILSLDGIKEEYYNNLKFWKYDFQQKDNIQTKSGNGLWYRELYGEYLSGGYIRAIDPLLQTKWGQNGPWNGKAPYNYIPSTGKCPLGCGPVALSQILYYFHFNEGVPQGLYHTIIGNDYLQYFWNTDWELQALFTISRDDYTSPSNRWSQMPVDSVTAVANPILAQYVGDFILDVGDRMNAKFLTIGTGTTVSSVIPALSYFNFTGTFLGYDYSAVYSDLTNSRPVYIRGSNHAWVIDGHHQDLITTRRVYIWHEAGSNWSGEIFTAAEAQAMIGDNYILRDGLGYLETTESYGPSYFHMNWGWNGRDNGYYAISSSVFTLYVDKEIVYSIHSTE